MIASFQRKGVADVSRSLPFADESFDKIYSFHVIEHIQNLGRVFAEIDRVLPPGGRVLLVYPAEPIRGLYVVPSAISKAGVEALTRSLAVEWGNRGIRMNAIAPGPIPTQGAFSRVLPHPAMEKIALDRNPLHRFGTVEELANVAAFLVSDGSGYINGEVIRMDGGEFLQGAGEFSNLGRILKEEDWQAIKPRKTGSNS